MKKYFFLTAFAVVFFSYSQKVDVNGAQKMFDSQNYSGVVSTLSGIGETGDLQNEDPSDLREAYYLLGQAYLKQGDVENAAKSFDKVKMYESATVYYFKDKNTKEKVYFLNKQKAESEANSRGAKVKEMNLDQKYTTQLLITLNSEFEKAQKEAVNAYNGKSYKIASASFAKTYYLAKAMDLDSGQFLFNAAIAAYQAEDFPQASEYFSEVISSQKMSDNPNMENLEKAYKLKALILSDNENWEELTNLAKEGLEKFPENEDLSSLLTYSYSKSGNDDAFIKQLEAKVNSNSTDPLDYYNLGILYSRDEATKDKSLDYFIKATQLKPDYKDAYINVAKITLDAEKELTNQQIDDSISDKDYDKNDERLNAMYKKVIPVMEQAHTNFPNDRLYLQMLVKGYYQLGDDANYNKYNALLKSN